VICPSCGGIVGRDCFDVEECAAITQQMAREAPVQVQPQQAPTAEYIRDAALAWLDAHRAECPNPKTCTEPLNLLAFIAHCLGVRQEKIGWLQAEVARYEAECEGCTHLRN